MEEKRIYSLNLGCYLIHSGFVNYTIQKDENNTPYLIFEGNISEAKKKYKEDIELRGFLNCFRDLKKEINKIKFAE